MVNLEEPEANEKKRRMIRKGKRKIIDHEVKTELLLNIKRTTIDGKALLNRKDGFSCYRVVAWTDPEDQYLTDMVKIYNHENWKSKEEVVIPLDFPARYLYIELLRVIKKRVPRTSKVIVVRKDPGTSRGTVVMGRARIRLPDPTSRGAIKRKVSLVLLNSDRCVVENGTLEITMQLHRYVE